MAGFRRQGPIESIDTGVGTVGTVRATPRPTAAAQSPATSTPAADADAPAPGVTVPTDTVGKDVFDVTRAGTEVVGGGDWDVVRSTGDFAMPDDVEWLDLVGEAAIDGTGTAGANIVLGNDAANAIVLGSGEDRTFGRLGDDRLDGGGGDLIVGGRVADMVRDRSGEDRFLFSSTRDSTRDAADTILDFESGIDVIDLSGNDADATRGGDRAFARGSSGPRAHSFPDEVLSGDVDGDGTPDLRIDLGDAWLALADAVL
jgi:Ca2+-binding RTX toxin-like protein